MIDTKVLYLGFVITGVIGLNIAGTFDMNMNVMAQDMKISDAGENMTAGNMTETLQTETEMEEAAERDIIAQRNMTSMNTNITG